MDMRTFIISFILLFVFSSIHAQTNNKMEITHLTGDFYIYTTFKDLGDGKPYPSNSMYLVTNKGVVLFDTPWDSTQFQPLLDSILIKHHQKAVLCISTHFHGDRTAGLAYFQQKGIKTYSSAFTKQLCIANNDKQAEFVFTKDTTFKIGNYQFETFYPGEGHSKDNIVIWFNKDKILYGGCFIKSTEVNELGNIADANIKAWPQSVKTVMQKFPDAKFVIPGHYGWQDKASLKHTLDLLEKDGNKK